MVSPEGTGRDERSGNTGRTTLVAVGIALLAVGAIALGGLTSASGEAVDTSTTTTTVERLDSPLDLENFSVAQIEQGQPIAWETSLNVTDFAPLGVIDHQGWTYVFARREPNFTTHTWGGLRVWRSTDGVSWENLGEVIDQGHAIGSVASVGNELVGLEVGQSGHGPTVWHSSDGIGWKPNTIPIASAGEHTYVQPHTIGGDERALIVAGDTGTDIYRLLEARLAERYPEFDPSRFGWGTDIAADGEVIFTLWGPLGFVVTEVNGDDLDLTAEEQVLIAENYGSTPSGTTVWVWVDGTEWVQSEIESAVWIESITALPSGNYLATGGGNTGTLGWISPDGMTWESLDYSARPGTVQEWNGRYVGPSNTGQAQIFVSDDGEEWDQMGPYEYFPVPIQWHLEQIAAGPAGVAALVAGWEPGQAVDQEVRPDPPVIISGEATLTLDFWSGVYRLDTPGNTQTWGASYQAPPEGIEIDLESATVEFTDPETGSPLASFDFDQIADAEQEYWSGQYMSETNHRAFVFTADGVDWVIDDIDPWLGDGYIAHLEVTEKRIIALVEDSDGRFSPEPSPGFEIWSATVP